ncbi:restriction endonuclease subunit S [Vibrio sp. 1403]|uniref:restriction endonuclease subunit S n=1 Tax=Vibrio sp. 1403 TaxID=3074555 RepID=UPI002967533F|nr:restriction endonuclease subunit S [Vibrio sp. 1403]MDW3078852.1 restriction endonuclease subunit S [Vibrio sp. 1403]
MVPNGWSKQRISDILERVVKSVKPIEDTYYREIGIRSHGKGIFHKEKVTSSEIGNKRVFEVIENAFVVNIVFAWEQAIAKTTHEELGFIASHRFPQFLPKDGRCDIDYLVYFFKTPKGKYLLELASPGGAGRNKTLGQKEFDRLELVLPPVPEQRKIAQILSTWDKAIATTEKLIDASKQQKKALMQQLLTGKKRLIDPETGKTFGGEWKEVKVGEFGKVVTGNTPPKNDDSNYGSDISWATAEDFKSKYVGNTKVKLTKLGASKARIVPKGSVLVTCIASIGKNAIAYENITTNQQINAVVINNNHCNEFFYYQIEFNKHKLLAWAGTTAVPILNKSSFEKIPLSASLKNEQQRIASVLTAADKEIELLEAKLAHFKQEKKALMQQLLTGKRRVKVAETEAA